MSTPRPPVDECQLDLIRAFLHTYVPSSETIDTFDVERAAQRFSVNPNGPDTHALIAMRDALDHPDLGLLRRARPWRSVTTSELRWRVE